MLELVVGNLVQKLATLAIDDLHDVFKQEASFLRQVKSNVKLLQDRLGWMQSFLKDVDERQANNKRAGEWIAQISDVTYEAEDVIDAFIFNVEQHQQRRKAGFIKKFTGGIKDLSVIDDIGNQIDNINIRLNGILKNKSDFGIEDISVGADASTSSSQGQQQLQGKKFPIVEEVHVVGLDGEVDALVQRLNEETVQRRAVISITGMGGIGKNTLAKKVCKDIRIKSNFDLIAWVYVSREFREYQVRELLLTFLSFSRTITKDGKEMATVEELKQRFCKFIEGKKYLLVIDDIWNEEAWDSLFDTFPADSYRSRVLLTTRKEEVARYADSQSMPHVMRCLREKDSWELFCRKAFPGDPFHLCPQNLEDLGKQMVAKCAGLPLAVAVLGGVLSRKGRTMHEWNSVLNRIEWLLMESPRDAISKILALSYYDLPYNLKSCFLYFSAYPEGAEISLDDLIPLWIAEGFVPKRGREELEDVAEHYVEELISRSMIQVAKRRCSGAVETCRVHDLLHDLAISIAKNNFSLNVNDNAETATVRRVAINRTDVVPTQISPYTAKLRSFLYLTSTPIDQEQMEHYRILCESFRLLRVLHLPGRQLIHLQDKIGSLIHLRYLALDGNHVKILPSAITGLGNLQTLDLGEGCHAVLPKDISKMQKLRHIRMGCCTISNDTQLYLLNNMQTLPPVLFGSWVTNGLDRLTKLRELNLYEINNTHMKALSDAIAKLLCLKTLCLSGYIPELKLSHHRHLYSMKLQGRLSKLPDPNKFPPNLIELDLSQSLIQHDPMGTLEKLPQLQLLKLSNACQGGEMVCSAGRFPLLQNLAIIEEQSLFRWTVDEGAMPNLRLLKICGCKRLRKLPNLQHITTLQDIEWDTI